ncbi:MAG: methyltransferase domain-containing protein [Candidatus Heimdallarchaeota archaeon]
MTSEKRMVIDSCCGSSSSEEAKAASAGNAIERSDDKVRQSVREEYTKVVEDGGWGSSEKMGYSQEELESLPEGADLGVGCGNPTAFALIQPGDVVVDLGSGAGIDCFLAAQKAGETGKVIGVDMIPQMLDKARANAKQGGHENVEFRLGEIEHLPIADNTVDLIISNCVICLTPNKQPIFMEAFRVLKPGGKIMIADLVLSEAAKPGSKGMMKEEYLKVIKTAGFEDIKIVREIGYNEEQSTISVTVKATKPAS